MFNTDRGCGLGMWKMGFSSDKREVKKSEFGYSTDHASQVTDCLIFVEIFEII